jgi:hypothetical protein
MNECGSARCEIQGAKHMDGKARAGRGLIRSALTLDAGARLLAVRLHGYLTSWLFREGDIAAKGCRRTAETMCHQLSNA